MAQGDACSVGANDLAHVAFGRVHLEVTNCRADTVDTPNETVILVKYTNL